MEDSKMTNKKIGLLIIGIAVLVVSITGSTFAYFALSSGPQGQNVINGTTASANLYLTVEQQELKADNTGKFVPQLDSAIHTAVDSTHKCVDDNGNVVCKVYKITVKNGSASNPADPSTATVLVNGTITFSSTTGNLKWRRIDTATSATTTTANTSYAVSGVSATQNQKKDLISGSACTPSSSSSGCTTIQLGPTANGTSVVPHSIEVYYIVVWVHETDADQTDDDAGMTFVASITFEGKDGKGVTSTITS